MIFLLKKKVKNFSIFVKKKVKNFSIFVKKKVKNFSIFVKCEEKSEEFFTFLTLSGDPDSMFLGKTDKHKHTCF